MFVVLLSCTSSNSHALNLDQHPRLQKALKPLVQEGLYTHQELHRIFQRVTLRKIVVKKKENSAERKLTWGGGYRPGGYRGIFLQPDRVQKGVSYWQTHTEILARAQQELGVEPHVIAAIIGVETKYGANKGKHKVIESIATFADRGSKLQLGQLPIFLRLVKQGHLDINVKGSYSGAMGIPQFISSSYRDFGLDFDEDGRVDLLNNDVDAIGSVANYFNKHGWRQDEPVMLKIKPVSSQARKKLSEQSVKRINSRSKPKTTLAELAPLLHDMPKGIMVNTPMSVFEFFDENGEAEYFLGLHNFYVIMRYNHSYLYARAVHELSLEIKKQYQ